MITLPYKNDKSYNYVIIRAYKQIFYTIRSDSSSYFILTYKNVQCLPNYIGDLCEVFPTLVIYAHFPVFIF